MITRFCLVRHGETDWNAERRIQGQLDIGLNAVGRAQARALRPVLAGLQIAAACSSDLARAWETALLATDGLPVAVSPAPTLRERHYGVYQGLTSDEALARHPEVYSQHRQRRPDYDYDTGETLLAFASRIMDSLHALAARHRGETVLAFTHGGVLDVVYRHATGRELSAPRDFQIPNAGLNWLDCDDGRWTVRHWADRRHLEQSLDETVG